jgi:hypothetical protein
MPSAMPATQRPTIIRATPFEAAWKTDPTIVKNVDTKRVFRRPSFSRSSLFERLLIAFLVEPMEIMALMRLLTFLVLGENI